MDNIVKDLANADYQRAAGIGATTARLMLQSPQLFRDQLDGRVKRKPSAALDFGTAGHCRILEPQKFAALLSDGPINERTGKPYGADTAAFGAWRAENRDAIVLSADDRAALEMMAERMPPEVASIFEAHADPEVSIFATVAGCAVKCRPDWLTADCCYDLKTIPTIDSIEKNIHKFAYWFAAGWYRMVIREATGKSVPFIHIFAERNPPYRWRIVELDADWIMYADDQARAVAAAIALRSASGEWSDYGDVRMMVSRPAWEMDDDDDEPKDGE